MDDEYDEDYIHQAEKCPIVQRNNADIMNNLLTSFARDRTGVVFFCTDLVYWHDLGPILPSTALARPY